MSLISIQFTFKDKSQSCFHMNAKFKCFTNVYSLYIYLTFILPDRTWRTFLFAMSRKSPVGIREESDSMWHGFLKTLKDSIKSWAIFTAVITAIVLIGLFPVGPTQTFAHPKRRLELRFRPKDPFCHSLCGNRFPSSNLLLRVRRRTRKKDPKDVEIQMELLGVIGTTYKFQG